MADLVVKVVGKKHPELAILIMGWIVSIPVFCDSGFVILNPIRKALTKRTGTSSVAMTVALSMGLYISHCFIPPTPGPIAAADSLGIGDHLLLVILLGAVLSIPPLVAGYLFALYIGGKVKARDDEEDASLVKSYDQLIAEYGKLPGGCASFAPIIVPIILMALASGLDAPIMNPGDAGMTETVAAARVLLEQDADSKEYVEKYGGAAPAQAAPVKDEAPQIGYAISRGLKDEAAKAAAALLAEQPPLAVVEKEIIPALDTVGKDYESGRIFLPQLIKSAEAAKAAFEVLRAELIKASGDTQKGKKIVIATVHGDIHDIGKNIVKVILENYNFDVTDLGKDVPPRQVIAAVKETGAKLVGLSALMTTTVASMRETIELLRRECPGVKVIVGGAVLTEGLAAYAGADRYAKDAMETVRHADSL